MTPQQLEKIILPFVKFFGICILVLLILAYIGVCVEVFSYLRTTLVTKDTEEGKAVHSCKCPCHKLGHPRDPC